MITLVGSPDNKDNNYRVQGLGNTLGLKVPRFQGLGCTVAPSIFWCVLIDPLGNTFPFRWFGWIVAWDEGLKDCV